MCGTHSPVTYCLRYLQLKLGVLLDKLGRFGGLRRQLHGLPVVEAAEGRRADAIVVRIAVDVGCALCATVADIPAACGELSPSLLRRRQGGGGDSGAVMAIRTPGFEHV